MSNHPIQILKSYQEDYFGSGLDLEPSEQVWDVIQANLPKKKKRRVLIIWFWAGLLLIAGIFVSKQFLNDTLTHAKQSNSTIVKSSHPNPEIHNKINSGTNQSNVVRHLPKTKNKGTVTPAASDNGISAFSPIVSNENSGNRMKPAVSPAKDPLDQDKEIQASTGGDSRTNVLLMPISSNSKKGLPYPNREVTCDLPLEKIQKMNNEASHKIWLGFHYAISPFKQDKAFNLVAPLSELIVGSYYNQQQHIGFDLYLPLRRNWSAVIKPSVTRENLITDYDLNIPYDYNSEKNFGAYNENYFSHSLPTDMGNIKTNLVVTRTSDSPVGHNELISLDFGSNQSLTYLSVPMGLAFGNGLRKNGLTAALTFVPEYLIHRSVSVDLIHSNHIFVSPKEVSLSSETIRSKWHLGVGLNLEYRLALYQNWSLQLQGNYNHYLTQTGRSNLYQLQVGIGKLF
ncbi:MAG: hypothetical protein IPN73_18845 [Saprospiraceae bacterium]|nr:hypothetical protein [Saprospiraceae bacterium]